MLGTSWFESQAATEYTEKEVVELPCVSAGKNEQDAFCVLCQDKFEQFYNQDIEEWQLRNATRVDGSLYHPACHQDHTVSSPCLIMLNIATIFELNEILSTIS